MGPNAPSQFMGMANLKFFPPSLSRILGLELACVRVIPALIGRSGQKHLGRKVETKKPII